MRLIDYKETQKSNDDDFLMFDSVTKGTRKYGINKFKDELLTFISNSSVISELKKSVSDGKQLVADAITAKGVTTATDSSFQEMADNIEKIESGGGHEPNLQSKTVDLSTSEQVVTPDDDYDGLSQVIVPGVTGNATSADVLKDVNFSSGNGINLSGTMNNYNSTSLTLSGTVNTDGDYYTILSNYGGKINTATRFRVLQSKFPNRMTYGYYDQGVSTSGTMKITLGYKPSFFIILYFTESANSLRLLCIYDEKVSTTQYVRAGTGDYLNLRNLGGTSPAIRIVSIDSDGVTVGTEKGSGVFHYFATP